MTFDEDALHEFWNIPEIVAWGFLSEEQQEILVGRLAADLRSGNWDKKFGHLRSQPYFTAALRLITADIR